MARTTMETTPEGRKAAGRYVRKRRDEIGIIQLDVAKALGVEYPQMIGQIESGRVRIPPARYLDYARVLKLDPKVFAREILKHYGPELWKILFGDQPPLDGSGT